MIFDDRRCTLGEGPLWHPLRKQLFWFDIIGKRLLTRGVEGPQEWHFAEMVSAAGWISHDEGSAGKAPVARNVVGDKGTQPPQYGVIGMRGQNGRGVRRHQISAAHDRIGHACLCRQPGKPGGFVAGVGCTAISLHVDRRDQWQRVKMPAIISG